MCKKRTAAIINIANTHTLQIVYEDGKVLTTHEVITPEQLAQRGRLAAANSGSHRNLSRKEGLIREDIGAGLFKMRRPA